MMPRHLPAAAVALLALVVATSGCSPSGLDFRADDRLTITTPEDRAGVTVPFPVEWTLRDQQPSEDSFAVLVDASPPRPGAFITDLLPEGQRNPSACDEACQTDALAARGVYLTGSAGLVIPNLPRPSGMSEERARRHRITVVALDADGRRAGELADSIDVDEVFR